MRQYIYLLLIALVLIVPFVLRHAAGTKPAEGEGASDAQRLIVITPNNQDIRYEFGRAFDAWHRHVYGTPVTLDWRSVGGTNDVKRFLQTTFSGQSDGRGGYKPEATAGIDLVWGGGDYFFDHDLKLLNILAPLPEDEKFRALLHEAFPETSLAGVKLLDVGEDPAGKALPSQWMGSCLSSFGIVYNPDLYASHALNLPAPRTWADLADPRLSGYVALADPTHSGSAAVAYMMVIQRAMADAENDLFLARPELKAAPRATRAKDPAYTAALAAGFKKGQGQLLLIAANARYFTDSATQVPNDVGNGEAAAGTSIDFYGRVYEETVGPGRLRFVLPRAATAITPDPVAILRGAPHPELARQFVEFLLSPEAQRLWDLKAGMPGVLGVPTQRALRRMPIRRDVYGDSAAQRTDWSDPQVNPFIAAGGFNQRSEWMKPFTELQQIWAAEWIDSRDSLRQAYDAVRAVHNAQRRQQLLVELADVPIDMAQVDALVNQDKDVVNAKGDVDLWRAQMRIKLAKDFRDHYQAVEVRARASRSD